MSKVLEGLNEEQLKAVTHVDGPLMIVAGAGTGKTTVMTRRIAYLIEQERAKPDEILALTFTDKAAGEMEERVDRLLPFGYVDLWISTFHSFCQRVLQEHGLDIGIAHDARLLTETETWLLMRKNWDRFEMDYYKPLGNPTKFLRALLSHISRAKDEGITPEAYRAFVDTQKEIDKDERVRLNELAHAYDVYEAILHEENALDFGGLILYTLKLLQERPTVLKRYQEQFKYVIVDEFQDTNSAQYELVKLIVSAHKNVAVVGDDDQAIYNFRGASIANILDFERDFPKTDRVVLTKNYRSVQPILDKAYDFIAQNNPNRLEATLKESHGLDKRLQSQLQGDGFVRHLHADTLNGEVQAVVKELLELKVTRECDWSDMAILVRANDHATPFLSSLDAADIPYRFLAMRGLYRKPIVLDAVALLRVIDDPYDSPSVYRLLSHPHIGIPERDLISMTHFAKRKGVSIVEAMGSQLSNVTPEGGQRIQEWSQFFSTIRRYATRRNALEVLAEALKQSGMYGAVLQLDEAQQLERSGYLQQFYERVRRFVQANADANLHAFLQEFEQEQRSGEEGSLSLDAQSGPDEVRIMTLHGSKGLEFRFVFIVNLVDRRFPAASRREPIPLPDGLAVTERDTDAHVEEERRLMYVGMTRAKERLYLTSADDYGGARAKKLSRFLTELGHEKPDDPVSFGDAFLQEEAQTDRLLSMGVHLPLPKAFSFTQLVAYDHCPLQYKFAHILKIPTFGSPALSFGKTMHNTLQSYFERVVADSDMGQGALFEGEATPADVSEDALIELYEQHWIDDWYLSNKQKEQYRADGEASLRSYYKHIQEHPVTPLFLERGFTVKIDDIVIRGRIDRIDKVKDGVEIIDYKTGSPKTEKDLSKTDKMQLMLYQLAAKEIFGLEPKRLTFHYLKDHSTVSFLATDEELDTLKQKIRDQIAAIRSRQFEAAPGFMCRYCDFRDICPFRAS